MSWRYCSSVLAIRTFNCTNGRSRPPKAPLYNRDSGQEADVPELPGVCDDQRPGVSVLPGADGSARSGTAKSGGNIGRLDPAGAVHNRDDPADQYGVVHRGVHKPAVWNYSSGPERSGSVYG